MEEMTGNWEANLWLYLSKGDGMRCPVYESCQLRLQGSPCLSDDKEYFDRIYEFLDNDELDLTDSEYADIKFPRCGGVGRIFGLVSRLADKYRERAEADCLPVPSDLITRADDNLKIEVRHVPLKVYHGAVWRRNYCWVIHINSYDTPARQRFTLYHEIFHILAHCEATPVFQKIGSQEGYFNELLADHFAANILLPEKYVKGKWADVQDVSKMEGIFCVPRSVMYFGLWGLGLI